jgi:hypothetical protein
MTSLLRASTRYGIFSLLKYKQPTLRYFYTDRIIHATQKQNNYPDLVYEYKLLREHGQKIEEVSKTGNVEKVHEMVRDFVKEHKIAYNIHMVNSTLQAHCIKQDFAGAMKLFNMIPDESRNWRTISVMLEHLPSSDPESIEVVLHACEHIQYHPDSNTFNKLVSDLIRKEYIGKAKQLVLYLDMDLDEKNMRALKL